MTKKSGTWTGSLKRFDKNDDQGTLHFPSLPDNLVSTLLNSCK
jgi:hypothetical protein